MRILIIDDDKAIRFALGELLTNNGYEVMTSDSGEKGLEIINTNQIDTAIVDYQLPSINGLEVLEKIKSSYNNIHVILITAFGNEEIAIKAIKNGAFDYVAKPFNNEELLNRLNHIKNTFIVKDDSINEKFGYYFSDKMKELVKKVITLSATDIPLLITGESGTGKELIARLAHFHSGRSGRFIPVNCSAIPSTLIESELFGAEKGAYTGAFKSKTGLFEIAHNGTIFLDEIAEMDINLQSKLLRALQENEITRIGSTESIKINTRVIAATNVNIEEEVKNKKFREDLFYRLNGARIVIPPLRERKDEIKHMAKVFLNIFSQKYNKAIVGFNEDAYERLLNYNWPGNIRELKSKIEEIVIFCNSQYIQKNDIKLQSKDDNSNSTLEDSNINSNHENSRLFVFDSFNKLPDKLVEAKKILNEEFEKAFIMHHLQKNNWKVSDTANKIGMFRQDLYKKIKKYGLERK
jgi:DNA-binding NtrC family response regulator